jgi:predicted RND superfamily exporter protein
MGLFLRFESSGEALIGKSKETSSDTVMIILKKDRGDIFGPKVIETLYVFQKELSKISGVVKIDSIFKAERVKVVFGTSGISLKSKPYFPGGKLSEKSRDILKNELYVGNLIDKDGKTVAFVLEVIPKDPKILLDEIKEAAKHLKKYFKVYTTGIPVADAEIESSVIVIATVYPLLLFGLVWFIYYLRLGNTGVAFVLPRYIPRGYDMDVRDGGGGYSNEHPHVHSGDLCDYHKHRLWSSLPGQIHHTQIGNAFERSHQR